MTRVLIVVVGVVNTFECDRMSLQPMLPLPNGNVMV